MFYIWLVVFLNFIHIKELISVPFVSFSAETVPNDNVSTVKSLHIDQTDSSSTEELSESGKTLEKYMVVHPRLSIVLGSES